MTTTKKDDAILKKAEEYAQQWVDSLNLKGGHDTQACLNALKGRTGPDGENVLALVVDAPDEVGAALAVAALADSGIPLTERKPQDITKILGLECSTEQYRMYRAQIMQQDQFMVSERAPDATQRLESCKGVIAEAYDCVWDYYWMAFYESAMQANEIPFYLTDQTLLPAFRAGVGFIINLGSVMVGLKMPEVKLDERELLHCEDGPAVTWGGRNSQYWWHNVQVPSEWIEDKENIDPATALNWENAEERRALCEIIGWEKILSTLKPVVVDEDLDPEIGTLLRVDLPDAPGSQFLKVRCGTGRTFVLPVPENLRTALDANAWTYNLDPKEYKLLETRT